MVAKFQLRSNSLPVYRVLAVLFIFIVLTVVLLRDDTVQLENIRNLESIKSSYDWSSHPQKHPIPLAEMARLPNGQPLSLPRIQYEFEADHSDSLKRDIGLMSSRRNEVRNAFKKSWRSYARHAWGYDELQPLSLRGSNRYNGWGVTVVESLDTLWLMGMHDDFDNAVQYVSTIDWNNSTETRCNVFETNIRYLGGLLSAYDLSKEQVLLDKAIELANMLYAAFDTPNRFPPQAFSFDELRAGKVQPDPYQSAAAIGSMSMEFTRVAQLTGDFKFYDAIERIKKTFVHTQDNTLLPGMWPNFINVRDDFQTANNVFKLGSAGDSLYEYLPKMHVLLGGLDTAYEKMYKGAAKAAKAHLLYRPMAPRKDDVLLLGTAIVNEKLKKIDQISDLEHLSCSAGGMFAMAGKLFGVSDDVEVGEKLTRGCAWAYRSFKSGLMPEKSQVVKCDTIDACEWNEQKWVAQSSRHAPRGFWRIDDGHYNLRPEAIESLFILYRITGKDDLLGIAWDMFQAVQKTTQTDDAHAAIIDVTYAQSRQEDTMESFFFAETLKYFYLIFSDPGLISLDEWVLSTEGHPFRRPTSS
ncbi:hypothetical protein EsH8_VII_000687 [Colletotrichum jinshuiense]